eukprot:1134332-Pyramimonas_sp.AAC.1
MAAAGPRARRACMRSQITFSSKTRGACQRDLCAWTLKSSLPPAEQRNASHVFEYRFSPVGAWPGASRDPRPRETRARRITVKSQG